VSPIRPTRLATVVLAIAATTPLLTLPACAVSDAPSVAVAAAPAPVRPRDPFVFRCVLDENPRMVVVALAEDLSLAYDATAGSLALAWDGDVKLQGAVYDTTHGPQPVHEGTPRLVAPDGPAWMLAADDGEPTPADVRWLGYRVDGTTVHLRYRLEAPGLGPVTVTEIPEIRRDGAITRLERTFRVEGGDDATVLLAGPDAAGGEPAARRPAPLDTSGSPPRRCAGGGLLVPLAAGRDTVVTIALPGDAA